ncbi:MAG TPA: MFS transporter [Bacilli bacterium]|nr:MFS transporter [Bacilli bacterium]
MDLKLNQKRTYLVGLAFMSITLFWTVYDNVIAKMLVDNFGLNQTWSGLVMALDNIFALFMLPFFGRLSDRTRTKYGRRKPFIVIGTVLAAVLIVGVSIFDLMQTNALDTLNISHVLYNGDTKLYYFTVNGIVPELQHATHVAQAAAKSDVVLGRAWYILENVTKANPGYLIGFVVVLFFVIVSMGIYRSPAVSLMPDVTPKPLRSKANAVINLLGALGGGVAYIITAALASEGSYILTNFGYTFNMAVTGLLMLLLVGVFTVTVKEPAWAQEMLELTEKYNLDSLDIDDEGIDMSSKGESEKMPKEVLRSLILILTGVVLWFFAYNAAVSKFSVYATSQLDIKMYTLPPLVATVAAAICFIPIGIISTKIGRRRMILIGIGGLTISFFGAIFIQPGTGFLMYVIMAMVGISWASINVNSYPMVVEMAREGDTGKYTGYYYTASMAAQIFTPILSGILMDVTKWMPSLFVYSTFFAALAFIPMFFVKHGEPVRLEKEETDELPPVENEE